MTTQQQLRKRHIVWKNLHILRDVSRAFPSGWHRRGCSDIFAAYITIAIAA